MHIVCIHHTGLSYGLRNRKNNDRSKKEDEGEDRNFHTCFPQL